MLEAINTADFHNKKIIIMSFLHQESCAQEKRYRAMLKSEFAQTMGVSMPTFRKYIKPFTTRLKRMGVNRYSHLLTPKAVHFLCEMLMVDIYADELNIKNEKGGIYGR